jgi:hypothetical protein
LKALSSKETKESALEIESNYYAAIFGTSMAGCAGHLVWDTMSRTFMSQGLAKRVLKGV